MPTQSPGGDANNGWVFGGEQVPIVPSTPNTEGRAHPNTCVWGHCLVMRGKFMWIHIPSCCCKEIRVAGLGNKLITITKTIQKCSKLKLKQSKLNSSQLLLVNNDTIYYNSYLSKFKINFPFSDSSNGKDGMAIFQIVLNDDRDGLHTSFVDVHPVICPGTMAEGVA